MTERKRTVDPAEKSPAAADPATTMSQAAASIQTSKAGQPLKAAPAKSGAIPVPASFGRYRIEKELGKGAMGVVYLAEDTQLHRKVALKIPKQSSLEDPETLERFYREARTTATLRHANICPVYDVGDIDGVHYLTMAYIPGKPVSSFLGKKLPPARQVALLIRKIALALDEAHKNGVVHRDLKPSNVMLDDRGEPIVMDFGLARQMNTAENARLTQSGAILGTPAYMAPEQVRGEVDRIGPASDIYALGVMLYQFLTGELPFTGPIMMVFAQVITNEPRRPSEVRPEVDAALEAICLKMMAKEIDQRYASMKEVVAALTQFLKGGSAKTEGRSATAEGNEALPSAVDSPADWALPPAQPAERRLRVRSAKPQAKRGAVWQKWAREAWNSWRISIGAALGLALVGVLAAVIYFETGAGTVEIQIAEDDPAIVVRFAGDTFTIQDGEKNFRVWPVRQTMVVAGEGIETETKLFTMKRGETKRWSVRRRADDERRIEIVENEAPAEPEIEIPSAEATQAAAKQELAEKINIEQPAAPAAAPDGWIDLLSQMSLKEHGQEGRWLKDKDDAWLGFSGGEQRLSSRLLFPAEPRGDYELEVEFRLGPVPPENIVAVNLPVGDREVTFGAIATKPKDTGFSLLKGRPKDKQPRGASTLHRIYRLNSATLYRLRAAVAVDGDQGSIDVFLDDTPWVSWSGPVSDLSCAPAWLKQPFPKRPHALGLGYGVPDGKRGGRIAVSAIRFREQRAQSALLDAPVGSKYAGLMQAYPSGSETRTGIRPFIWHITRREGDQVEVDYLLEDIQEHWTFKGQLLKEAGQAPKIVIRDVDRVDGDHPLEGTSEFIAELLDEGRTLRGTGRADSGWRSEFEGTLADGGDAAPSAAVNRRWFTVNGGEWSIDGDELVQSDADIEFAYLNFGDKNWTDYDFEVDAMRTAGRLSAAPAVRQDGPNFYLFALGHGPQSLAEVHLAEADGDRPWRELARADQALSDNEWYHFRVSVRGSHLECWIEHPMLTTKLFDLDDNQHGRGRVGLRTVHSAYRFKNLRVTDPDGKVLWEGLPALDGVAAAQPAPPAGENLALVAEAAEGNPRLLTVDALHYDGSMPLTLEFWFQPDVEKLTELVKQAPDMGPDRNLANTIVGFDSSGGDTAPLWAKAGGTFNNLGIVHHVWLKNANESADFRWNFVTRQKRDEGGFVPGYAPAYASKTRSFQHVAVTLSPLLNGKQRRRCWVDGKRVAASVTEFQYDSFAPFGAGRISGGILDEIRLSSTERYANDFVPERRFETDAETIALYHCDEGAGEMLIDASGNARHGALKNARWIRAAETTTASAGTTPPPRVIDNPGIPAAVESRAAAEPARDEPVEDFQPLFNGKDLSGWTALTTDENGQQPVNFGWKWEGDEVVCTSRTATSWLRYDAELRDFELSLECRLPPESKAGIHLRYPGSGSLWFPKAKSVAIQLEDAIPKEPTHRAGAIFGIAPPNASAWRRSGWNQVRIRCEGRRFTVMLNGQTVVDASESAFDKLRAVPDRGYLGLLNVGNASYGARFRKVRLRILEPASTTTPDATPAANPADKDGWITLFNGTSRDHWTHYGLPGQGDYQAVEGVLKKTRQLDRGLLAHDRQFDHFVLKLDYRLTTMDDVLRVYFRLRPHGNRPPTQALAVQLVDNRSGKVSGHPALTRRANGALFDLIGPELPVNVPFGGWHALEVRAVGPKVTVKIDRQLVLSGNLKQIDGVPADSEARNESGVIGLQYFKGACEVREIRVLPLDAKGRPVKEK
jgi:tRNA A-37 threonylcarbamoyl transferase component Bud32